MAISIKRGFALVGGLVVLVELISIAVLIAVALNGRREAATALSEIESGAGDLGTAREAEAESELDYRIIEGLAMAEVIVLLVAGGVAIWLLHRNLYRPPVDLDASIARHAGSAGEKTHVAESGPSEIRRIARTFNQMMDRVADQDRRESAFLAGIAHDLRNPLMVIRGSTEILLGEKSPSPASRERACARILKQLDAMERMLSDFVDARGIASGMLALTPEENDLGALAREVTERFRPAAPGHQLELQVPPRPIPISCDGVRMEQVLVNLITNAIKYSPDGGRVVVRADGEGEWATLSVIDQGIGIPADQLGAIFEPFRRVAARGSGIAGSGLGLAVTKRIVERHGGRIEVESEAGRGSTFRVLIPSAERPAASPDQRA